MNFKYLILLSAFVTSAANAIEVVDAEVVSYEPVYDERITRVPYESCQEVRYKNPTPHRTLGGSVVNREVRRYGSIQGYVGASAGQAIGSQIGGGSAKRHTTEAGRVIGARIGDSFSTRQDDEYLTKVDCRIRFKDTVVRNLRYYTVTLRYNDMLFYRNSSKVPSSTMKVTVY